MCLTIKNIHINRKYAIKETSRRIHFGHKKGSALQNEDKCTRFFKIDWTVQIPLVNSYCTNCNPNLDSQVIYEIENINKLKDINKIYPVKI